MKSKEIGQLVALLRLAVKAHKFLIAALGLFILALNAAAVTRYVDLNNPNPTSPYLNWATAAANIQEAVDAAEAGDLVLVTNGVYSTGGQTNGASYLTNRLMVTKPLVVRSVNGAAHTIIEGYQVPGTTNSDGAIRCVLLGDGASLTGFTLTNGGTLAPGGAIVTSDQDHRGRHPLPLDQRDGLELCASCKFRLQRRRGSLLGYTLQLRSQ